VDPALAPVRHGLTCTDHNRGMPSDARILTAIYREAHDALAAAIASFGPDDLRAQSYCSEWDVAHVLSHLGSGAVINLATLEAVVGGVAAPGQDFIESVWSEWNAKSAEEMASGFVAADERLVSRWEELSDEVLDGIHVERFGMQLDAAGLVSFRSNELVMHLWDVEVTFDDAASLQANAVPYLLQRVPQLASRTAKPAGTALAGRTLAIRTTQPSAWFSLDLGDPVAMTTVAGAPGADDVVLPAEALVRLVYGRLDSDHVPSGSDITDDVLAVFSSGI
jgi:uncharacterized protein (TIGR03083 family)